MPKRTDTKKVFSKDYFLNYYKPLTGNFESRDLTRNKNWFHGWFDALSDFYNFSHGKNRYVLEVGCAIGAAADILHERGFRILATDISSYAVRKARKLLPHINFEVMDIEKKQKYHDRFDLIYAFEVIEHLANPEKALRNMYTMLRKNGSIICSTPYPYKYVYFDSTHINVRYPNEWIKAFRDAGFNNVKYKHIGFIPFLYRFSKHFHLKLPFGLPTRYFNSTIFIHATK